MGIVGVDAHEVTQPMGHQDLSLWAAMTTPAWKSFKYIELCIPQKRMEAPPQAPDL